MLRALALLLLLANLGFHAWTQGWLSPWLPPPASDREPQRLAAQLHPERIVVLRDGVASAAVAAAQPAAAHEEPAALCLEAGPFDEAGARVAEALLAEHEVAEGAVTREIVARNHTWGVVIGRLADREALRARAEELTRLKIRFEEMSAPSTLVPGLRLQLQRPLRRRDGARRPSSQGRARCPRGCAAAGRDAAVAARAPGRRRAADAAQEPAAGAPGASLPALRRAAAAGQRLRLLQRRSAGGRAPQSAWLPRCAQPVVRFSTQLKSSYIAIAIAPMVTSPAKASGMRCWLPAVCIR